MSQKNFKARLGIPTKSDQAELVLLISEMKFILILYGVICFCYFLFFILTYYLDSKTFDRYFGNGFGISLSASVLEDLVMFILLSFAVSLISIRISSKKPEDNQFDDRIRALMNSHYIQDTQNVFEFLKANISKLLAFNRVIKYDVYITHYFPDKQVFCLLTHRTQVTTNMCKDREFESRESKVFITTDQEVNGSYGKLNFLGEVDPNNFNHVLNYKINDAIAEELSEGRNPFFYDTTVKMNSEFAFQLKYQAYSKFRPLSDPDAWNFCTASKFCTKMEFSLFNNLKDRNFRVNVRRRNADGQISDLALDHQLTSLKPFNYTTPTSLVTGDKIEFFINLPN